MKLTEAAEQIANNRKLPARLVWTCPKCRTRNVDTRATTFLTCSEYDWDGDWQDVLDSQIVLAKKRVIPQKAVTQLKAALAAEEAES